jgi:hypothetical protein
MRYRRRHMPTVHTPTALIGVEISIRIMRYKLILTTNYTCYTISYIYNRTSRIHTNSTSLAVSLGVLLSQVQ